jgi:hypothetical protein
MASERDLEQEQRLVSPPHLQTGSSQQPSRTPAGLGTDAVWWAVEAGGYAGAGWVEERVGKG